ncbi:MAG: hypothetical protein HZA51_15760 [Planctomycetes bacterium]|nr:hypothetical protein [Planctomycetota bacterium]
MNRLRIILVKAVFLISVTALPVHACAVCGGDKDSDMVKGALSGVVVMVVVTYGVLLCFAGMIATFVVRARRLARAEATGRSEGDSASS